MTIRKIKFGSVDDLVGQLTALSQGLASGYISPGAVATVLQARDALTALTAEADDYEAMLRSALGALSERSVENVSMPPLRGADTTERAWPPSGGGLGKRVHGEGHRMLSALVSN